MNGLGKRLTALEQIAEECRRREQRDFLRTEITRQYATAEVPCSPDQIDARIDRALVLTEHMALLAASGLTLGQIARRVAVAHDLDPERVVANFSDLRAQRGRA
jgi:hypothetical protein